MAVAMKRRRQQEGGGGGWRGDVGLSFHCWRGKKNDQGKWDRNGAHRNLSLRLENTERSSCSSFIGVDSNCLCNGEETVWYLQDQGKEKGGGRRRRLNRKFTHRNIESGPGVRPVALISSVHMVTVLSTIGRGVWDVLYCTVLCAAQIQGDESREKCVWV